MQDARFDCHLTGVKKESFYWRTKTIAFRESKNKGKGKEAFQGKFVIVEGFAC